MKLIIGKKIFHSIIFSLNTIRNCSCLFRIFTSFDLRFDVLAESFFGSGLDQFVAEKIVLNGDPALAEFFFRFVPARVFFRPAGLVRCDDLAAFFLEREFSADFIDRVLYHIFRLSVFVGVNNPRDPGSAVFAKRDVVPPDVSLHEILLRYVAIVAAGELRVFAVFDLLDRFAVRDDKVSEKDVLAVCGTASDVPRKADSVFLVVGDVHVLRGMFHRYRLVLKRRHGLRVEDLPCRPVNLDFIIILRVEDLVFPVGLLAGPGEDGVRTDKIALRRFVSMR